MYVVLTTEEKGRHLAFKVVGVVFLISSSVCSSSGSLVGNHACGSVCCVLCMQERNYPPLVRKGARC